MKQETGWKMFIKNIATSVVLNKLALLICFPRYPNVSQCLKQPSVASGQVRKYCNHLNYKIDFRSNSNGTDIKKTQTNHGIEI